VNAPQDPSRLAHYLSVYAHLQERTRAAKSLRDLWFTMANETYQLFAYRQGFVWQLDGGRARLRAVSGLAQLGDESPLTLWLRKLGRLLGERLDVDPDFLNIDDVPADMKEGWKEWMPELIYALPVRSSEGRKLGVAAYALEEAPPDAAQEIALRGFSAYAFAWDALVPKRRAMVRKASRYLLWLGVALAVAAMFIPVRLSVLAPAEVVALDAMAISAPIDGVIKNFSVQPNQEVKAQDLLFTLDDTTLRNRREVALKQLQVTRADALAAEQKAFSNDQSRAELAALNGKVAEKSAEVSSVEDLLKRVEVRSPGRGVIVFGDINDWQGKPVVTGERIALLADPKDAGVLIWLPVSDALNIETGAPIKLYLQVAPLKPLEATLTQTSYQAVQSPDGISAYRLRGKLTIKSDDERALARVGLRGTAKIYSEKAALGYYLFRRPLASLRELTGF
jgi:multidrug resistance efflux pump